MDLKKELTCMNFYEFVWLTQLCPYVLLTLVLLETLGALDVPDSTYKQ